MRTPVVTPPQARDTPDYDGRWKDALDAYVGACLALFWPELHAEVDWSTPPVFRDKELQRLAGARRRGRRHVDKLVDVHLRGGGTAQLFIHIEVQGRVDHAFLSRMYTYHYRLRDRHPGREAIHLGIATRSPAGPPMLTYRLAPLQGRFGHLEFAFPVVHLADWRGRQAELLSLAAHNPFAIVVLADLASSGLAERAPAARLRRKTELTRLLYQHGYGESDVHRLFVFIDGVLTLPPLERLAYTEAIARLEGEYDVAYVTSVERVGIQKGLEKGLVMGREQGRADGVREALAAQLEQRFGALPPDVRARIGDAAPDVLLAWLMRVLEARSLDDVFG
ncbi:hypothetical protein FOZ76_04455 [Verticiella sediminum]|uniref:DUF4351 domain-containing protein n=1 Tax=Verticiella sediminum TaxID=1247510 RepID=A0A556AYN3_9BURK|nr:hypothetical protein [Verticiella sediminum]TSH98043.1 hypothetical protein FOZ76_04455 [Verticiella sediminum]